MLMPASPSAADSLKKEPEYYNILREEYGKFSSGNEVIAVSSDMGAINTRTTPLLTTDVKRRKLIGVRRDVIEESLMSFNIGAKVLTHRSNDMWVLLLVTEETAKSLTGNILTTKSVRLQTEYTGTYEKMAKLCAGGVSISQHTLYRALILTNPTHASRIVLERRITSEMGKGSME